MILVLLGTFPTEFKRPLIVIEELLKKGIISEEVVVQNGYTQFNSEFMVLKGFIPVDELKYFYLNCSFVISHGGSGSIINGLKLGKKVIAVPRLSKYGEVVDDHQLEIVHEFSTSGYLLPWYETDNLEEILLKISNFQPKLYQSQKDKIIDFLDNYISSI